jgi:lysyl-tRNA synthetase class 2
VRDWRATSGPASSVRRAAILRRLRDYFESEAVLEVDTPALSTAAASDVQIESLEVHSVLSDKPLFLHTSPEFCMKRLLASGYPDIYSICRVFRDGEAGRRHQPEFTMVEWYRHGYQLDAIIADTLKAIAAALGNPALVDDAIVTDYRDVFIRVLDIDPLTATIMELADAANADTALRTALGDERDSWLDLLISTQLAATFANDRLTVIRHYPATQAALAQICPDDSGVADRFEVFFGPLECANGYVELTDAQTQAARIAEDQAKRQQFGRRIRAHDESLIHALAAGLPPCAGTAMGLERLQMVHDQTDDIRDVIPFLFEDRNE